MNFLLIQLHRMDGCIDIIINLGENYYIDTEDILFKNVKSLLRRRYNSLHESKTPQSIIIMLD